MWELDHKEGWVLKNWFFLIVVLEKTLASPLDRKEIKPVNPKWNQPWIFIERTDAKVPIFWPLEPTYWKRSWCWERLKQKEKQVAEMIGWHHRLNEHKFEQTPGDNGGQRSLPCCSPWGWKQLDPTEQLNNDTRLLGLKNKNTVAQQAQNSDWLLWVARHTALCLAALAKIYLSMYVG